MRSNNVPNISDAILKVLDQRGKDCLALSQFLKAADAQLRKALGVKARMKGQEALPQIQPHLPAGLRTYTRGASNFIGKDLPPAQIILRRFKEQQKLSPKALARYLPIGKADFIDGLNCLLRDGLVACTFNPDYHPALQLGRGASAFQDERAAFKAAYDAVSPGARYVRIHRVRQHLNWPRERFDQVLRKLSTDYTIALHGGDPSIMTEQEIKDSYMDENNLLCITLTWER